MSESNSASAALAPEEPGRSPATRHHRVRFAGGEGSCECGEGESLLSALHRLDRREVRAGCRNGGCGVCKVQILEGQYATAVMSRAHVSPADEAEGRALACRVFPRSDMLVQVALPSQGFAEGEGLPTARGYPSQPNRRSRPWR